MYLSPPFTPPFSLPDRVPLPFQFSDHELVRRASTEALCNLLPHPKMIDHLKVVDTLKLWAAFSQLGEEDPPTAAAALGGLAMAVRDPEVRATMHPGSDTMTAYNSSPCWMIGACVRVRTVRDL